MGSADPRSRTIFQNHFKFAVRDRSRWSFRCSRWPNDARAQTASGAPDDRKGGREGCRDHHAYGNLHEPRVWASRLSVEENVTRRTGTLPGGKNHANLALSLADARGSVYEMDCRNADRIRRSILIFRRNQLIQLLNGKIFRTAKINHYALGFFDALNRVEDLTANRLRDDHRSMTVGMDKVVGIHDHAEHLHRTVEVLQMGEAVGHAESAGEKMKSGISHFLYVADSAVGEYALASQREMNIRVYLTPIGSTRLITQILNHADLGTPHTLDVFPICGTRDKPLRSRGLTRENGRGAGVSRHSAKFRKNAANARAGDSFRSRPYPKGLDRIRNGWRTDVAECRNLIAGEQLIFFHFGNHVSVSEV
jgi:hypothetical protein